MKRYIYSKILQPVLVDIDAAFTAELKYPEDIAAATYKDKYNVPDGPLLPADKNAVVSSQAFTDFRAFVEAVYSMINDQYDLHIYYENDSIYRSFYYAALAKNNDGSLILRFRSIFRISTHEPEPSPESDKHKKEERAAARAATGKVANKDLPRVLPVHIIVNEQEFDSYLEAIEEADNRIAKAVEIMERTKR